MALNATLGKKGGSASRTHVTATVTADKGESGIKIVSSKLKVVAEGLQGVQPGDFAQIEKDAEKACPVSNALRALQIDVEAQVK